jgi:hypothetical protein
MPSRRTRKEGILSGKHRASGATAMARGAGKAAPTEAPIWAGAAITDPSLRGKVAPYFITFKFMIMEEQKRTTEQDNNTENQNENENLHRVERTIGAGGADQDANADRGGTTDLAGTVRRSASNSVGSGMSTKLGRTGSDFDGQINDQ